MPKKKVPPTGNLRSIFSAMVLALLFRSTAVQAFNIPTGSATPTLLTGDTVLMSKFTYGYARFRFHLRRRCSTGGCSAQRRRVATWWVCQPA